jgi:hypothetical protein
VTASGAVNNRYVGLTTCNLQQCEVGLCSDQIGVELCVNFAKDNLDYDFGTRCSAARSAPQGLRTPHQKSKYCKEEEFTSSAFCVILQVQRASRGHKVMQVLQVFRDYKVYKGFKEWLALWEQRDLTAYKVILELQDLRDLLDQRAQ